MFLHAPLQKNTCLSKPPVPPPRETIARGKVCVWILFRICSFIKVIGIRTRFWKLSAKVADRATNAVESEPETAQQAFEYGLWQDLCNEMTLRLCHTLHAN